MGDGGGACGQVRLMSVLGTAVAALDAHRERVAVADHGLRLLVNLSWAADNKVLWRGTLVA